MNEQTPPDRTDASSASEALEAGLAAGFGGPSSSVLRALQREPPDLPRLQLPEPDSGTASPVVPHEPADPAGQAPAQRYQLHEEIDVWPVALAVGESLPTLPLALRGGPVVPLDLEALSTEACSRARLEDRAASRRLGPHEGYLISRGAQGDGRIPACPAFVLATRGGLPCRFSTTSTRRSTPVGRGSRCMLVGPIP